MPHNRNGSRPIRKNEAIANQGPEGWFTPEDIAEFTKSKEQVKEEANFVLTSLPIATQRAERLVAEIEKRTEIKVPELYLHVAADTAFHFVLLVSTESYHAPEMAVAHILAEEFTIGEDGFDVHFTFSIREEFAKRSLINSDKYTLKRLNGPEDVGPNG